MNSWHTKVPVPNGQGGAPGGVSSLTILSIKPAKRSRKAALHYSLSESGRIEIVVVELGDADWFIEEYRGGVMIACRTFIPADQVVDLSERLEFVSRADAD
jgi:hypothetical protein